MPQSEITSYIVVQSTNQEKNYIEYNSENVLAHNKNNLENQIELKSNPLEVTVLANNLIEDAQETEDLYTKDGNLRKRKKYNVNLKTHKLMKLNKIKEDHMPLPSRDPDKWKKKCNIKISEVRGSEINKQFWDFSWLERRTFISVRSVRCFFSLP